MSAFTPMTRDEAIAIAKRDGKTHIATIRMANGDASIAARSHREAANWVEMQRGYFYPGTDRIEEVK